MRVAFAQEFEPIVTEPVSDGFSWWLIGLIILGLCVYFWWKRRKTPELRKKSQRVDSSWSKNQKMPSHFWSKKFPRLSFESEKISPKKEEGVKWIGKPQLNYQWILIGLLLLIIAYQWFPTEEAPPPITSSPTPESQKQPKEESQPPMIAEDLILDESTEIPTSLPESPQEIPTEEIIPSEIPFPEITPPASPVSTTQSAERELENAKRAVADFFKAMTNANREGKDIKEARIAYGEANQLYYRAYLALNNDRDADSIDLSHKAKEKAQQGMARLSS